MNELTGPIFDSLVVHCDLGLTHEAFMVDFLGHRKILLINGTREELELEEQQENAWLDKMPQNKPSTPNEDDPIEKFIGIHCIQ